MKLISVGTVGSACGDGSSAFFGSIWPVFSEGSKYACDEKVYGGGGSSRVEENDGCPVRSGDPGRAVFPHDFLVLGTFRRGRKRSKTPREILKQPSAPVLKAITNNEITWYREMEMW